MKNLGLVSFLLFCAFLASCQVKQGSGGDLVSGHLPATNTFTLITPTAKTYTLGEVITFDVSFPFDIILDDTGGDPQLSFNVGSNGRTVLGVLHEPRKLRFQYTVVASEIDTDGVVVNSLSLNGSTLKYSENGTITDCNVASVTSTTFPNAKVDSVPPTITAFTLTNLLGLYNVDESINYTIQFSEPVTVTGTPYFTVAVNTPTTNVSYVSGSGTNLLTFSFAVITTHVDTDGYNASGLINLNGGTIKDALGNNSSLDFSTVMATANSHSANVDLNGVYPYVTSITPAADSTYTVTQNMDYIVNFNRSVTVSGTPYLPITVGSSTRQAAYVSGSPGTAIRFRYQVIPGDYDTDGVAIGTSLTANGGGITGTSPASNYFANVDNNIFVPPSTPNVLVSAQQPQVISVARNVDTTNSICTSALDNYWVPTQFLYVSAVFNTPVYVDQTSGTPSIPLTFTSGTRQATYLSGGNGQTTLVFQYQIVDPDEDLDGAIGTGTINLNGGVITDAANTNVTLTLPTATLTNTYIDGTKPTITSVTPPANGTYSTVAPLINTNLTMTVLWSESVRFSSMTAAQNYLAVDFNGTNRNFTSVSTNPGTSFVYTTTALTGLNDNNGVTLTSPLGGASTITDCRGNVPTAKNFTLPNTTGILVDTTPPTVTTVAPAIANGYYSAGDTLNFTATFSEPVTTLTDGTYPQIPITVGVTPYILTTSTNGTASTTHTFRYAVVANDIDTDGVDVGTTFTNNGTTAYARDAGRNLATAAFAAPNTSGILVDATAPTVSSVSSTVSGTYVSGDTLQIQVTYSEIVNVVGSPYITLDFDAGTDNLVYSGGNGTSTITFSRTLDGTHFDMTGMAASINSINLNGGTIKDVGNNDAPTTFTAQDFSAVYVTYAAVKVWARTDFVNMAPAPAAALTNGGAISTEACGTGMCRTFDGSDSLALAGSISNIRNVFLVTKIPASTGFLDLNMFTSNVRLATQFTHYDLTTSSATVTSNGTTYGTDVTSHDTNFTNGSTYILQVVYQSNAGYSGVTLIPTSFDGAIGEVIAADNTLTAPQRDNIRNYLDSRF